MAVGNSLTRIKMTKVCFYFNFRELKIGFILKKGD
jgi:hypothetical protein